MPNDPLVTPRSGAAPKAESKTPSALDQIPALQAVLAGAPAAVSTPVKTEDPQVKQIWDQRNELMKLGIAFYRSMSGDTGVIFNALRVHPEELKSADKAGKLQELAPPISTVNQTVGADMANNPILGVQDVPRGGPAAPAMKAPGAAAMVQPSKPSSGAVQRKLGSARAGNITDTGPTEGMRPGAGRVLNALLKPPL